VSTHTHLLSSPHSRRAPANPDRSRRCIAPSAGVILKTGFARSEYYLLIYGAGTFDVV